MAQAAAEDRPPLPPPQPQADKSLDNLYHRGISPARAVGRSNPCPCTCTGLLRSCLLACLSVAGSPNRFVIEETQRERERDEEDRVQMILLQYECMSVRASGRAGLGAYLYSLMPFLVLHGVRTDRSSVLDPPVSLANLRLPVGLPLLFIATSGEKFSEMPPLV
uniref:Uncharacterized protein n=1 Tax=Oryza brachyantha TaxID=4533 RepID=J3KX86_ORYBR